MEQNDNEKSLSRYQGFDQLPINGKWRHGKGAKVLRDLNPYKERPSKSAQRAPQFSARGKANARTIRRARNLDHSRENLSSIHVYLAPEDLREIEAAFSRIKVHGGRMNAIRMSQIGKD